MLKFRLTPNKTHTIVQVYAPTSVHTDESLEHFYDLVKKVHVTKKGAPGMFQVPLGDYVVIGDFNAKIGRQHELDNENTLDHLRSSPLAKICTSPIAYLQRNRIDRRQWPCVATNGLTHNEIDYIPTIIRQINN